MFTVTTPPPAGMVAPAGVSPGYSACLCVASAGSRLSDLVLFFLMPVRCFVNLCLKSAYKRDNTCLLQILVQKDNTTK